MIYFFQSLALKTRFLAVLLLFFPVLLLWWLLTAAPWSLAQLNWLSGGAGLPDQRLWYDPTVLQGILSAWGPEGRQHYLTVVWPTDLAFLLTYGTFLTTAILYWLKKVNPPNLWWIFIPWIPLLGTGFDLLEDLTVALVVVLPAEDWAWVGWIPAVSTGGKWVFHALALVVLGLGTAANLIRLGWQKLRSIGKAGSG